MAEKIKTEVKAHHKAPTKVLTCNSSCPEHEYQDRVYGRRKRVMNPCAKGHRCTVCGNVQ